jgi:hypothetical protein
MVVHDGGEGLWVPRAAPEHRTITFEEFGERAALPDRPTITDVVDAVHAMPYGRPAQRTAAEALHEWRGTCSTKHALLSHLLAERWPWTLPRTVHRVYRWSRSDVVRAFGPAVASTVPDDGICDVHRYLTLTRNGDRVDVDVTFPSMPRWDGRTSMRVACGPGTDYPAGPDPDADKRALERRFTDPRVREPFIAGLAATSGR